MPQQTGSSARRIRIGLTGLALAFLLVLLGSVINRSSRDDDANTTANAAANQAAEPNEPLAELGVAPGTTDATTDAKADAAGAEANSTKKE